MKSNKGITLLSLVVYICVFLIVLAIIANISDFFYKNITTMDAETTSDYEYNKLNLYLLEETKKPNNKIVEIRNGNYSEDDYVDFYSGTIFMRPQESNKVYLLEKDKDTKILLCDNVKDLSFIQRNENGKNILEMTIELTSLKENKSSIFKTTYVFNYSDEFSERQGNDEYNIKEQE